VNRPGRRGAALVVLQDVLVDLLEQQAQHEEDQPGQQERPNDEPGHPAAPPRPEAQRRRPLQVADVELPRPVHPVEQRPQAPVEADERVALEEVLRLLDVGQLELIARDRVAQLAERQEAVTDDAVEQLGDHLVERGPLDRAGRRQADVFHRRDQHRGEAARGPASSLE